jgi:transposase
VVAEFLCEVRPDFRVSDRLGAQMGWAAKDHQACLAYLLRDIQYATNNGSEQALRRCVVFRKVTNCFRSERGATFYANVKSVLETTRRRGIGILPAIRHTLNGTPLPVAT